MCAERTQRLLDLVRGAGHAVELEPQLQSILSAAADLTGSQTASILEFAGPANQSHAATLPSFHRRAVRLPELPVERSAAAWVIQNRKPLLITDTTAASRLFPDVDQAAGNEVRSLLAVPVFHGGELIGALEALNKTDDAHYTEEDVSVLETLAAIAGQAIRDGALQRRLQSSYNEMAELNRLKDDFVAITSHELRTPLGLILGHATYLREQASPDDHEQLDAIIRNATRLKEIIENLTSMDNDRSGVARLRRQQISMARVVEDVISAFQEMARQEGVLLKADFGALAGTGADLIVQADGVKIGIALSHLVRNALTFTGQGGQVIVRAESTPGAVQVAVSDNGLGIPAGDLPRIFERFFQVESHLTRRYGGMGLGLSVAKAMIEMHGGRIWAESVEGKGSRFTFLVPVGEPPAAGVGLS